MSGLPYDWFEGLIILFSVCVLLVLVIILSVIKKIGIGKEFAYAIAKGGIQLFIIALFLTFLFEFELWYLLIWVLLVSMVLIGGYTSAKRASDMPKAHEVTTPSILCGSALALIVLAATRAMPMEPQFIVPLSGMAFGNSMAVCSLTLDRLMREVRLGRLTIETALSLGATSQQALEDLGRLSVRASLIPTIDRLKTLGIIFIPGAMSGLLIAGTNPILAAEYQIIVFLMIVGGGLTTSLAVYYFARKKIFNAEHQLEDWV